MLDSILIIRRDREAWANHFSLRIYPKSLSLVLTDIITVIIIVGIILEMSYLHRSFRSRILKTGTEVYRGHTCIKFSAYCTMQSRAVWEEWDGSIVSHSKEPLICLLESQSLLRPREGGLGTLPEGCEGKISVN